MRHRRRRVRWVQRVLMALALYATALVPGVTASGLFVER